MRLLVVGALAADLGTAARMAMARGIRLSQADDVAAALRVLRDDAGIDLVLCDLAQDIASLLADLRRERMRVPVVATGTDPDPVAVEAAIVAGARDFLPLPPDPELIAAMLQAVSRDSADVIARDPVMLATLRRAEMIARADASVLICGESGTGKEVLARIIHRASRRVDGPFVAVNCAAIPEALLESELFGHEKGAFSGAVARRIGKFEAAQGGTLLLDEITEMDLRLQAKLLRAVQEREIDRVGGSGPVKVDVRILATSNRDLPAEVAAGRFREDLYFRLNVITLRVPSLRERPADIPALAAHFAARFADVNGLPDRPLTEGAIRRLVAHGWRGNVRELENAVHRAVLFAAGDMIGIEAIELCPQPAGAFAAPSANIDDAAGFVGRTMRAIEQEAILRTLQHTLGNRTHAAEILGISIRALRNKLRDYADQGAIVPKPPSGLAIEAA